MKFLKALLLTPVLTLSLNGAGSAAISLEEYAKPAQFIDIKISPTGRYLAATSLGEAGNVYLSVIDINSKQVISTKHFRDKDTIGAFNWANDERIVINVARLIGALEQPAFTGELFAINADGSKPVTLTGPRSRSKAYEATSVIHWLPNEDKFILIASSPFTRTGGFIQLKRLNIENGRSISVTRAPLRSRPGNNVQMLVDNTGVGRLVLGVAPEKDDQYIMMYRSNEKSDWTEIMRINENDPVFNPLAFLADNKTVVGVSDTQTDTQALTAFDPVTLKEEVLAHHPKVNLSPIFSFENGNVKDVIGGSYDYEKVGAIFFGDVTGSAKEYSNTVESLVNTFPGSNVQITSSTKDGKTSILRVSSANSAAEFYIFDNERKQLSYLLDSSPWLKKDELPQTQVVIYKSRDGLDIHSLLTLPKGVEAKNLPLIMLPHGGPHGPRDYFTLDPDAKVLAQHGYAVLQPNFRGSGGFGRRFEQAGYRNWGKTMIDDMTDGVLHLAQQGIIDKNRVCSYGASYGGYAALMSAVREPELYKCVVGFVGVFDLNLMYTDGDIPERASGIRYLEKVIGRDQTDLDAQSPLKQLERLKAPVFIIHGGEDQRVPIIHANRLREELIKRNHPYEWLVKDQEGHGFFKPEHNVERWQQMLAFFEKYIGKQ